MMTSLVSRFLARGGVEIEVGVKIEQKEDKKDRVRVPFFDSFHDWVVPLG